MIQSFDEPISVVFTSNSKTNVVAPASVVWAGRTYPIIKVGLHHKFHDGKTLFHIFSVVSNNIFFRISLNTDNLFWRMQEVSDGLPG